MRYIQEDVFKVSDGYILQLCNCISVIPTGMALKFEKKFPGTCPYYERKSSKSKYNLASMETRAIPGTLAIRKGVTGPAFINIFGQYCPGYSGNAANVAVEAKIDDTNEARERYFAQALEGLVEYFVGTTQKIEIVVPKNFGLDNFYGNMDVYTQILQNFENEIQRFGVDIEILMYE